MLPVHYVITGSEPIFKAKAQPTALEWSNSCRRPMSVELKYVLHQDWEGKKAFAPVSRGYIYSLSVCVCVCVCVCPFVTLIT